MSTAGGAREVIGAVKERPREEKEEGGSTEREAKAERGV